MAKFTEDDFDAGFEKIAEDCYDVRADMLRATSPTLEKTSGKLSGAFKAMKRHPGVTGLAVGGVAGTAGGTGYAAHRGGKKAKELEKEVGKKALQSSWYGRHPKMTGALLGKIGDNLVEARTRRTAMQKKGELEKEAQRGLGGPGLGGGPYAAGPGGACVCPKCGHKESRGAGVPCREKKCPKCGALMSREGFEKPKTAGIDFEKLATNWAKKSKELAAMEPAARAKVLPSREIPMKGTPAEVRDMRAIAEKGKKVTVKAEAGKDIIGAAAKRYEGGASKAMTPQVMQVLKKGRKFPWGRAAAGGLAGAAAGGLAAGGGYLLGRKKAASLSLSDMMKIAQPYGQMARQMPRAPEPQAGFSVKHPTAVTTGATAVGMGAGAGIGYGAGKAIDMLAGASGAGKAGAIAGGAVGALLGAAVGSSEAEKQEEAFSHQLVNYLMKQGAEKPKPKKPSKIQYIYGKTPESVRGLETSEAAGKRIGTGVGKMMARATAPVRAATWLPRKLLFPKELKEVRESGKTMASAGGAAGGALGRLAGRLGGAKSESVPYVGPARTLALARAAGAKTMQKGLPSLPSVVESPTVVVKKK